MNIEEALKILGLDKKFSEEDLKKAYREKSKMYHSDKHSNDSDNILFYTRMQQDINVARDVLKNYLKQGNKLNNSSNAYWDNMTKEKYDNMYYRDREELNKLKKQYKEEIRCELDHIYGVDLRDKMFMKWKDRFLEVIYDFFLCIDNQPNTISLKLNYAVFKEEYFKLKCWYLYDHWNHSKIIDFAGNLEVDKNDGIDYVRVKMKRVINNILNNELDEFKMLDDYIDMEPLLLWVRDAFADICLYGYLDIEKIKMEFKNKIVLEINKYNQRKEIIDNLTKYYGYPTKLVVDLHNNILYEDKFKTLYNDKIDFRTKIKVRIRNMFSK